MFLHVLPSNEVPLDYAVGVTEFTLMEVREVIAKWTRRWVHSNNTERVMQVTDGATTLSIL